jgi:hypothetical protein
MHEINTNLLVTKTNRTSNTESKDAIIKDLGKFCQNKTIDQLDKKGVLNVIDKLDDNYHTNWSLFGKKTHTESTIIAWVLIFNHLKKKYQAI